MAIESRAAMIAQFLKNRFILRAYTLTADERKVIRKRKKHTIDNPNKNVFIHNLLFCKLV